MNAGGLLGIFGMPSGSELIVVGVVALLIFGKRLPEVARSLGKGLVEFKKGLAEGGGDSPFVSNQIESAKHRDVFHFQGLKHPGL